MVLDEALSDPVTLVFAGLLLAFVFVVYLFLRRTLVGFREGLQEGRR
jgi:hypothetical protein